MDNFKLADVEIHYDIDKKISKIIIDGKDYSSTIRKVETIFDTENRIPIVKLEMYSDNLVIKGKTKVDIK